MSEISVIIPVYNVEHYLSRCIDSVLNQTFKDFECILVDDGSTDNSGNICDEYALKDKRIKVIHKKNAGAAAARNTGLDYVFESFTSNWLSFIDSDDWVHPQYLELLYNAAKKAKLDIVVCSNSIDKEYKKDINKYSNDFEIANTEDYYVQNITNATVPWGKLFKRQYFINIRFPELRFYEDEFIIYKVLFSNKTLVNVKYPIYHYFSNNSSIMNSSWTPERLIVFDAIEEQINYFNNNNYQKAYLNNIDIYFYVMKNHLKEISKYKNKYRDEKKKLLNKYKNKIKEYKAVYPLVKHVDKYSVVYPILTPFDIISKSIKIIKKDGVKVYISKIINKLH